MATRNLYQLYDTKAEAVGGPLVIEKRDGPAIRAFYDLLANPQTTPGQHPADFELRWVGRQDEDTGELLPIEHIRDAAGNLIGADYQPRTVVTGTQWMELRKAEEATHDGGARSNGGARIT